MWLLADTLGKSLNLDLFSFHSLISSHAISPSASPSSLLSCTFSSAFSFLLCLRFPPSFLHCSLTAFYLSHPLLLFALSSSLCPRMIEAFGHYFRKEFNATFPSSNARIRCLLKSVQSQGNFVSWSVLFFRLNQNLFSFLKHFLLIDFRERRRKGERQKRWFVVQLIYAFIGWFLMCPTGDRTHDLGISGRHSNQPSYSARAKSMLLNQLPPSSSFISGAI